MQEEKNLNLKFYTVADKLSVQKRPLTFFSTVNATTEIKTKKN